MMSSISVPTIRFKSLRVALLGIKPFILDGTHLKTGRPFVRLDGLRSRELLANWLLSVVLNYEANEDRFTFSSDPAVGDGAIVDGPTGRFFLAEHVMVAPQSSDGSSVRDLILEQVARKQNKGGRAYASGRTLVVFVNFKGGKWWPDSVARRLPRLDFESVWVVGLQAVVDGCYTYGVTHLHLELGNAPVWLVHISRDFKSWNVETYQ